MPSAQYVELDQPSGVRDSSNLHSLLCEIHASNIRYLNSVHGRGKVLFAEGETIIQDAECIRESYPGFEAVLEEFTNPKRMQVSTPVIGSLAPVPAQE